MPKAVRLSGWWTTPFPLFGALGRGASVRGYSLHELRSVPERIAETKRYISEGLAGGRFRREDREDFPLEQAREAYDYLESNQQVGRVVIMVP